MAICPHCGHEVPDDAIVCPYCGAQLNPDYVVCGNCGRLIPADAKVCPYCGAELSDTVRCPNCGREIPADAKSCPYCGYRFDTDQPVVNIEYKPTTEAPIQHAYKIRAVTKPKKEEKKKTLLESEVFASAPVHATIGLVLSFLILILGIWSIFNGYKMLSDVMNGVGENTTASLNATFFSYATLLSVELILLFVGLVYSFKYFTIQEKEIVCAFIYVLIFLTHLAAGSSGFVVGFIWGAQHSQTALNNATSIYAELAYFVLLLSAIATYVSAYSARRE